MTLRKFLLAAVVGVLPVVLAAQGKGIAPADLHKPLGDIWPTYSGDYSGKRYSALKLINKTTVKNLTLAWVAELNEGMGNAGGPGGGGRPVIVGGEGTGDFVAGNGSVKGSALIVDGTIYITMPDNAWALDARDGHEIWHYYWKTRGGTHIANRGLRHVEQLSLHGDAGQLPGVARRDAPARSAGTRSSPTSACSTSRRRRRSSSAIMCSSVPATISTLPDSFSRSIPRPASCSGSSIPCR